jgi:hypothetical protein
VVGLARRSGCSGDVGLGCAAGDLRMGMKNWEDVNAWIHKCVRLATKRECSATASLGNRALCLAAALDSCKGMRAEMCSRQKKECGNSEEGSAAPSIQNGTPSWPSNESKGGTCRVDVKEGV